MQISKFQLILSSALTFVLKVIFRSGMFVYCQYMHAAGESPNIHRETKWVGGLIPICEHTYFTNIPEGNDYIFIFIRCDLLQCQF